MVELIVVLAIIGVMSAIILPVIVGSGKPQAANAKAKSFYYATQNVFINLKMDKPEVHIQANDALSESYFTVQLAGTKYGAYFADDYYFIEAEATENEGFTKITVALFDDGISIPAEEQYKCLSKALSESAPTTYRREEFTSGDLIDSFNSFSNSEDSGYYYAIVDRHCRVIATYWADESLSVLSNDTTGEYKKTSIQFIDNNKVDYTVVGAFPEARGSVGDYMFKVY